MKKTILFLALMALSVLILAQTPESFNYQVVVRDGSTNSPLTNQDVSFKMSILKGSSTGESQYSELHSANTSALGIVNLVIGNGTGKTGNIITIDWGADTYYLKVEIDKNGGTNYVEMGITQLLSVPYAMHSKSVTGLVNADNLTITNVANPVYNSDAVNKAYIYELIRNLGFIPNNPDGTVTDIDGNTYSTVTIGSQVWFAENLKTTKLNNAVPISLVTLSYEWNKLIISAAYCWFNNDPINKNLYGALYNFPAVVSNQLCPNGWHVPTKADWTILTTFLGGETVAGGKLKEAGTVHWLDPNTGTNESGFTGLPGGYRNSSDGVFYGVGQVGIWWSSSESYEYVSNSNSGISFNLVPGNKAGCSVRCLKNE